MNAKASPFKIALTGGPGGGKTTAADLLRREFFGSVAEAPEAATIAFSSGLARMESEEIIKKTQRAIYHLQIALEDATREKYQKPLLVCDRGTIDGAAYWPNTDSDYFASLHTTMDEELGRYDAVIFFDTAAMGGLDFKNSNHIRNENLKEAIELNEKLKTLWAKHPNFIVIPHQKSFLQKLSEGIKAAEQMFKA